MTEKELHRLLPLWKKRLALDLWDITLKVEPTEDTSSYMEVSRSTTHDRAVITVAPWVMGQGSQPTEIIMPPRDDQEIEASLVHELLHCTVSDMMRIVYSQLDGLVHRDVENLLDAMYRQAEEHFVDRTSIALVAAFKEKK